MWLADHYGTLDEPVAANLIQVPEMVTDKHLTKRYWPLMLAWDAQCRLYNSKPVLKPGTGVKIKLPPVGGYSVGVVNVGGLWSIVLQNTRLNLVVRMATTIASAITQCLTNHCAPTHQPASAPLNVFS